MNAPDTLTRPVSDAAQSALLADLYQFTMLQAYHAAGMHGQASFELFCRRLPSRRGFLMAAGLEPALEWLEALHFQSHELDWLGGTGRFTPDLIAMLRDWRFTGEVCAVPEGTILFPGEPLLRVTAPIGEAQLVESRVLNLIHAHSLIATKAARCVMAAGGVSLIEFGMRRAHGADAAMIAARASVIAGFEATANVLAGMCDGLPLAGTMAHSFVLAHEAEAIAFEHFGHANPGHTAFVIDTYDTEQGAHRAVAAAHELARHGIALQAVRIDSGDLARHSHRVRRILDSAGLDQVKILVSGDLDEWSVAALRAARAPIDAFCVGTALSTSSDAPSLDLAYKLVEYEGRPCSKRSPGKATLPGRKQVWRRYDARGRIASDLIALADEPAPAVSTGASALTGGPHAAPGAATPLPGMAWQALLWPVMRDGHRLRPAPSIEAIRRHAAMQLNALPAGLRSLGAAHPVSVSLSPSLKQAAPGIKLNPKTGAAADQHWNPSRPPPAPGDRRSPARPRPGAQTR
jgi:nicotinate phosphoribosyltransferase